MKEEEVKPPSSTEASDVTKCIVASRKRHGNSKDVVGFEEVQIIVAVMYLFSPCTNETRFNSIK